MYPISNKLNRFFHQAKPFLKLKKLNKFSNITRFRDFSPIPKFSVPHSEMKATGKSWGEGGGAKLRSKNTTIR